MEPLTEPTTRPTAPALASPAAARRATLSPEARQFAAKVGRNIDFRNELRDLRLSLQLTQAEVARIVDEDQADISRFERGERNPTLSRMEKILSRLKAHAEQARREAARDEPAWNDKAVMPAQNAALYLCAIRDDEDSFTNLKLQKLLYYAQAYATVYMHRPLFGERIKAWDHGPVVPQVRYEYKHHDARPLPRPEGFDVLSVAPAARAVLDAVYADLGQFEAWRLRDMTHREDPWLSTPRSEEIQIEAIRDYFEQRLTRR